MTKKRFSYLEEILSENPSDHPTIVLSQINFGELKHLVDFMYAGEVAVDQNNLNNLLVNDLCNVCKGLHKLWSLFSPFLAKTLAF
jgi:hypothetical protein